MISGNRNKKQGCASCKSEPNKGFSCEISYDYLFTNADMSSQFESE